MNRFTSIIKYMNIRIITYDVIIFLVVCDRCLPLCTTPGANDITIGVYLWREHSQPGVRERGAHIVGIMYMVEMAAVGGGGGRAAFM